MPSTTSSVVSRPLASSTVITPSLPTFSIASLMIFPMVASPLAEMVPTWAISFAEDGLGEHGRGGGAVAGHVGGLGRDLLHHLRAHVLELVLQLDLLGHRHSVLRDGGGAERLLDHHVAALGPEGDLHRVGERVDALEDRLARADVKQDFLGSHFGFSP